MSDVNLPFGRAGFLNENETPVESPAVQFSTIHYETVD